MNVRQTKIHDEEMNQGDSRRMLYTVMTLHNRTCVIERMKNKLTQHRKHGLINFSKRLFSQQSKTQFARTRYCGVLIDSIAWSLRDMSVVARIDGLHRIPKATL